MIPRIEGSYHPRHRREVPVRQVPETMEPSLFSPVGPSLRKLVVMIDDALFGPQPPGAPTLVLGRLLLHPFVRCYRYLDNGRPPESAGGDSAALLDGWIVFDKDTLRYWDGERVSQVFWDFVDPDTASVVARDRQAVRVAVTLGADFFITERDGLLVAKGWLREYLHYGAVEPPCYRVRDGLALVGLYLRAQGEYVCDGLDGPSTFGPTAKKQFLRWAARAILPAISRWSDAVQRVPVSDRQQIGALVASLGQRIELALDQRDKVHWALNQPDDVHAVNEMFASLDDCLVLLMGAYDAAAGVAHQLLRRRIGAQKAGPKAQAKWQRQAWLAMLANVYPELASLVAEGSAGYQLLTILRLMRNTIHSESITMTAAGHLVGRRYYPMMRLPAPHRDRLLHAIDAIGNRPDWGVQDPGDAVTDPGVFLERLFPSLIQLLDELMDRTPLAQLSGAVHTTHGRDSPTSYPGDPLSSEVSANIRYQIGMEI